MLVLHPRHDSGFGKLLTVLVVGVGCITAVVLITLVAVRHADQKTTADFRRLQEIASSLDLPSLGTVRLNKQYGGHQVVEGQNPTLAIVVVTRLMPDQAQNSLDSRLARSAFHRVNDTVVLCGQNSPCQYSSTGSTPTVGLVIYRPGETIRALDLTKPDFVLQVPPNSTGLLVTIQK